jgi:nucleotide-binding universal stress UspA family protein
MQVRVWFERTPTSARAIDWAAGEAAARRAPLEVIACYDLPAGIERAERWDPKILAALEDSVLAAVEIGVQAARRTHKGLEITTAIRRNPNVEDIYAGLQPDDLVVVAAPDFEEWSPIGRVLRPVMVLSVCPLVILPRVTEVAPTKRIVVGVNGSAASAAALAWAGAEATRAGVSLRLVHCWAHPYLGPETHGTTLRDLVRTMAATTLEDTVRKAREMFPIDIDDVLLERGTIAGLLSLLAPGDLLVVGSSGGAAAARQGGGSVTQHLLQSAPVPVVAVPASLAD